MIIYRLENMCGEGVFHSMGPWNLQNIMKPYVEDKYSEWLHPWDMPGPEVDKNSLPRSQFIRDRWHSCRRNLPNFAYISLGALFRWWRDVFPFVNDAVSLCIYETEFVEGLDEYQCLFNVKKAVLVQKISLMAGFYAWMNGQFNDCAELEINPITVGE